jgi:Asp/Glu/hydantoin racemase
MGMKVIVVHSIAADEGTPGGEWVKVMANAERDCMREVANPDTEIVMRFPRWGMRDGLDGFFHPLTNRLTDRNVYHQIVAAEKEGFDAAITACYYDPLLQGVRTAVDIPVVGIAEASMHMAAILGYRFGVVSISPEGALDMDQNVDRCGLRQKCVGVISMKDTNTGWLADTLVSPPETLERTIEEFKAVSRQLIARGADVICCG